ncbi:MAG TPA: NADH-quinone oxidoreductase subunit C [Pyrinomonadaceae bacterium]|nr:NADH-quinone oxidoreductase subunit C [Pyrinomonadaceae bacterium]
MTDDTKKPPHASDAGDAAPASDSATPSRRTDDTSPSPGYESTDAGGLPAPPTEGATPTPESQAALTGKAPSGSSTSGTTVPAASSSTQPPPGETPEEKIARLKRVVEEAKARKAAREAGGDVAPAKPTPTPKSTPGAPPAEVPAAPSSASTAEPPGGASPSVGDPLKSPSQSDLEKASKIAEAKARAAAAKEAAGDRGVPAPAAAGAKPGVPAPPKAPVKKKEEGPKPADASDHPLVKRLREQLDGAVLGAETFIGQLSVRVARERVVEVCRALRDDAETPFNYLSDLTCVHRPDNFDAPFELVYNLYSISGNERVRVKASADEAEGVESVTGVWPAANWMEREVFDLFGVRFHNHPDLRRILLPQDWDGHPLRKDYPLEAMENEWTVKHLPEFSEVAREQLEQRRAYGLEILSSPYERRVREVFRAGKEVMPKEHR